VFPHHYNPRNYETWTLRECRQARPKN